jgi:DnaJ-domain-containing protein 1
VILLKINLPMSTELCKHRTLLTSGLTLSIVHFGLLDGELFEIGREFLHQIHHFWQTKVNGVQD